MDLRLEHLGALDGSAAPLPHGTEVVTRVDRILGQRRVPEGAIGRVVKVEGDAIDVALVGVGVV